MKKLKRAIQIFCLILFSIFIFDQFVTKKYAFSIDHGGMVSSNTKEEAIKRGTYLYDVVLPKSPYKINDSMELEIKDGWIERCWRTKFWYWDTYIDTNCGYNVTVIPTKKTKKYKTWMLKQKRTGKYRGYSTLFGYGYGSFVDMVDELPSNDTIQFYAVTEHNAHFNDSFSKAKIIGELKLVIKRK